MLVKHFFSATALPFCLFLMACAQPRAIPYEAPLVDEGKLQIFLQPIPQEAHRLTFDITDLSLIRDDDSLLQLEQKLTSVEGEDVIAVQKLLSSSNAEATR